MRSFAHLYDWIDVVDVSISIIYIPKIDKYSNLWVFERESKH